MAEAASERSGDGAPDDAGGLTHRLRRKLDWTYGLLAWTAIVAPLAMLTVDGSGGDLISLAAEAIDSPLWESVVQWLVVLAIVGEFPVSAVAMALGARFPRRRMLLALVLADLVVVMRYLVYPVLDDAFPASILVYAVSRGLVLLYGVTGLAICTIWFVRGRRRFGVGDRGVATARAQLGDPYWPADGPISRRQLDLAYGCFAWATFGWQAVFVGANSLESAISYFTSQLVPGTAVVTAATGFWLLFRVRREPGLVVLAMLALSLAAAIVSAQVIQQAEFAALVSRARTGEVVGDGIGVSLARVMAQWLGWTFIAAQILGPVLLVRWCCMARLSRETFDPQRDRQGWPTLDAARITGRRPETVEVPPGAAEKPPRVAATVTFWWYVAALAVTLTAFVLANMFTMQEMWIEFRNYGTDRPAVIGQFAPVVFFYVLAVSYGLLLLVPPVVTLPLAAFTASRWKRPTSILLLRPFHQGRASRALAKVVRRDLGSVGHVYSLADADIHVPWYMTLSTLLGQLSILSFGYCEISRPRQLDGLVGSLRRPWFRSVNWAVSWSKVFPISTTDTAWVGVVRRLLESVDLVVVDVSVWRPNVVHELELCSELGVLPRVVCIARAGSLAQARARLDQDEHWRLLAVHPYDDAGNAPSLRLGDGHEVAMSSR